MKGMGRIKVEMYEKTGKYFMAGKKRRKSEVNWKLGMKWGEFLV